MLSEFDSTESMSMFQTARVREGGADFNRNLNGKLFWRRQANKNFGSVHFLTSASIFEQSEGITRNEEPKKYNFVNQQKFSEGK